MGEILSQRRHHLGGVEEWSDPREEPVRAVHGRRPRGFSLDGENALALLAGALRDQLLDPHAEARNGRADEERQLVAPGERLGPEGGSQESNGSDHEGLDWPGSGWGRGRVDRRTTTTAGSIVRALSSSLRSTP